LPVVDFEALNLSVRIDADFAKCALLNVGYAFEDPKAVILVRAVRYFLIGSVTYAMLAWIVCVGLGAVSMNRWSAALGLSAMIGLDPVPQIRLEPFGFAVFLAVYRTFSLSVLVPQNRFWVVLVVVAGYGVIDVFAAGSGELESVLLGCHIVYALLIVHGIGTGLRTGPEGQGAALVTIGPILLVPAVMAIVEICLKRDASTLPLLLSKTPHVAAALVCIFLQNGMGGGVERTKLVGPDKGGDLEVDIEEEDEADADGFPS
jgi:hypothetical protein